MVEKNCKKCFYYDVCYAVGRMPERAETCTKYVPDVEEVRHGEWKVYNKTMFGSDHKCSLCGNLADEDNSGNFAILTKYCSNCGAKMYGQTPEKIDHDSLCETETWKVGE